MTRVLLLLALLLYLARGGAWLLPASASASWSRRLSAGWLLGVGVALHGLGLLGEVVQEGATGSLHIALGGLALMVMLGSVYLRRLPRMEVLEHVLLPLSALLLGLGLIAPGQPLSGAPLSWWLPVHIGFMVLGLGGMAVTFSLSVLYLWVRRRLKAKKLAGIARLPSLAALDELNQRCMILGFVALTAGTASGALWVAAGSDIMVSSDATIYVTTAVWLWYALGLHLRMIAGYRGQIAAWFGVVGFAAISVLMLGASLLLHSFHTVG